MTHSDHNDLTRDQLVFRIEFLTHDLNVAKSTIKEQQERIRMLRYALRGMAGDKCFLKVSFSPVMTATESDINLAQVLVRNHAAATASEIEKRIGEPSVRLREALLHINYLENHATSSGLPFKPFEYVFSDKVVRDFI